MRQCRGILEREQVRDGRERTLRRADVVRERALSEQEQVGEHPVSGSKPRDARADRLDHTGDIEPQAMVPRRADADDQAGETGARPETIEVGPVDGRGDDSNEHLVVASRGAIDIADLHDIDRSVSLPDGGAHEHRW